MKINRTVAAAVLVIAIGAPIMAYETGSIGRGDAIFGEEQLGVASVREFPSLGGATGWLNSPPLTPGALRGKVVLVDFWTYTCINWRRQLPYVRAWAEKYKGQGLVVIGVHTPEFAFEKDVDNIRWAVKDMNVGYPVAIDSDYGIWRAFDNAYWPALYFIDAQGRIRHTQFGEGDYGRSESVLQKLLAEAGASGVDRALISLDPRGSEATADIANLRSPETYLGHARTENFASEGGIARGKSHVYAAPSRLRLNSWALSGDWTVAGGLAALNKSGGRIAYQFHARDVHLVMGPAARGASVRFRVLIDGRPPGAHHGVDVDDQGNGIATLPRMYQVVRQSGPIADKRLEVEFLDPGIEAFSFTFG
jgi:thiol-disulfide isomerase/thioredoxin